MQQTHKHTNRCRKLSRAKKMVKQGRGCSGVRRQ